MPNSDFTFWLGIHNAAWIERTDAPLFISMSHLWNRRKRFKQTAPLAIDSGGFTELKLNGEWTRTPVEYVAALDDLKILGLNFEWAAPQDWMVEPFMLERTGLTLEEHQRRTVDNFTLLRYMAPDHNFIPVLQGWTLDDYFACFDEYEAVGIDLRAEPLVGVGSVCRRQSSQEIEHIMRSLHAKGLNLHGFGVKTQGLQLYSECLESADSLAWSAGARRSGAVCSYHQQHPRSGLKVLDCRNCLTYGLEWREKVSP